MRAFVSHETACDVLRRLYSDAEKSVDVPRWPQSAGSLPPSNECVSGRRAFRSERIGDALSELGVTTTPVNLLVPSQSARSSGNDVRFHVWSGVVP